MGIVSGGLNEEALASEVKINYTEMNMLEVVWGQNVPSNRC